MLFVAAPVANISRTARRLLTRRHQGTACRVTAAVPIGMRRIDLALTVLASVSLVGVFLLLY
jgi:hypothetical protein